MKNKKIFLSPPHMSGNEMGYIQKAFDENYITSLGSNISGFEEKIKEITGAKHSLALINATAAIHLALRVLGIEESDEVFASSFTFIGSVAPVLYQKAVPFFIDSDKKSWNLDPVLLENELKRREINSLKMPKALILTHLYGQMADIERIMLVCDRYKIAVIEDAAESLGATFKKRHSGTFGRLGVYSFNGNKILTTSGGGLLISDDEELIKRARFLSTQAKDDFPHYEHTTYGYNYRMSNILAGVGIAQLEVLDERVDKKRKIFDYYRKALADIKNIEFMPELEQSRGNRWLTALLFKDYKTREKIRLGLEKEDIESRPLWKPMHMQPLFKEAKHISSGICEELFQRGLCLPSGTAMQNSDLDRVVSIIRNLAS